MEKGGSDPGSTIPDAVTERAGRLDAEAERDSFRTLFMEAPAAFALLTGPDHRYVLSNRMNQEFAGGRELVGKTVREALPELEAQGLTALVEQVYRTGEPFVARDLPVALPATPSQPGRIVHLSGVYQPVRAADGRITGIMAFAYEVTDLVKLRRAAEQSEERFRLALTAADLGTWDYDPKTRSLTCDARFRDFFGVPPDAEVTAALALSAIHPDDRDRVRAAAERAFDPGGDGSYTVEYRAIGIRDGTERWISARGRTFFDQAGTPVRFTGAALEITEQVRARDRLEEAERRAAMIADAVPQIVWTSDPVGVADFYNRRWYEYTGLEPARLDPLAWASAVHPDDLPTIKERWTNSLETGEPFQVEARLLRAVDRAYRWHLAQCIPVKDGSGRIVKWVGSSTDIDDQKRVETITRFLGDASALLSASLDSETTMQSLSQLVVPRLADWCAIYLLAPDDRSKYRLFLAHADPAKIQWARELTERYPPDADAPRGAFNVMRTGRSELLSDIPEALLAAAAKDARHLEMLRAVGMRSAMTVPIAAGGRVFGAISFVSAESGRRYLADDVVIAQTLAERAAQAIDNARLYAEAQEAVRVRDEFMAIASHELKTPLTPLHLQLQALQHQAPEILSEKVMKKLEVMTRQVSRLERLVVSLVDISRITAGRFDIEREYVDLAEVVRDVAERFGPELEHARCDLTVDAPDAAVGWWDRLRAEQIVNNLLSNAIKFGAGKPIEVRVTSDDDIARLVIRDHGIGISADDQARIFGRFERAVASRHYGGFGLGLWIVRQVVEALGGSVSVESRLGVGSTFTVLLPQAKGERAGNGRELRPH